MAEIIDVDRPFGKTRRSENRTDYLSWDEYFMAVAFLSAQRSKDPRTQVGACIVNDDNKIVGIGYNGMPIGCSDDFMPWGRDRNKILESKYLYVCHAEMNAILNKNSVEVRGCKIYVALFPCNECAKLIIQSGIKEVIYCSDKYSYKNEFIASRMLLKETGVKLRQFESKRRQVMIDFDCLEDSLPTSSSDQKQDKSVAPETTPSSDLGCRLQTIQISDQPSSTT